MADLDAVTVPATGEVLIVTDGLTVFHSTDGGRSFIPDHLTIEGRWPSAIADGNEVFIAAGWWGDPQSRIFIIHSGNGGATFGPPVEIALSSTWRVVDPELLRLAEGRLLVFYTEVQPGRIVHLAESLDNGASWSPVSLPVIAPDTVSIEDGKAIEVQDGVVLFAYEREFEELGASQIEQIASADIGRTWSPPTVIWGDVEGADVEPGGFQRATPGELWFVASTDEDAVGDRTYTAAIVKRKASLDGGSTWGSAAVLVDLADQIVFGVTAIGNGLIGLATVRHYSTGPRTIAFYRVPAARPGELLCSGTLFVSRFEHGLPGGWSDVSPALEVRSFSVERGHGGDAALDDPGGCRSPGCPLWPASP